MEKKMIIDLMKNVPLKEFCKIIAHGDELHKEKRIEFTFSHDAIIGFATELLGLYEEISEKRKVIITTYQLQLDPAPNQAVGFYLTPTSPVFMLKINPLIEKNEEYEYKNWKEINRKEIVLNQYYEVKDFTVENYEANIIEPYELLRKNIVNISVFSDEGIDITKKYDTVIMEMNRGGMKAFATMLLVWANNCREGDEYILPHIQKGIPGYNLGLILTHDSVATKFKCQDLGTAYDYDSRIQ